LRIVRSILEVQSVHSYADEHQPLRFHMATQHRQMLALKWVELTERE